MSKIKTEEKSTINLSVKGVNLTKTIDKELEVLNYII